MRTLVRLRDDVKQISRAFSEPRVRLVIGLFVLTGSIVVAIRFTYPTLFPSILSDLLISAIGAIFGVYISIELLLPYVRHVERSRIDPAEEIVEAYEDTSSFLDTEELPATLSTGAKRIPISVEHSPETIRSYESLECMLTKTQYSVPDELAALYEADADELRQVFQRENRTNGRKVKLETVSDTGFDMTTTTYYRSFLTNFCPDYELSGGATLRELTKPLLFEGGSPKPLTDTPFSDHFGGGGVVITTDGYALMPVRSRSVAVEGKALHLSFSGSFDVTSVESAGVGNALREILTAELSVKTDEIQSLAYLGTTRRIERLGKPDTVGLVLVDSPNEIRTTTDQFIKLHTVEVCEGPIEEITDLFEATVARQIITALINEIDHRPYRPSIGLVSFLCLYWKLVTEVDTTQASATAEPNLRA